MAAGKLRMERILVKHPKMILALVLVLTSWANAAAQEQKQVSDAGSIELSISAKSDVAKVGEDILLRITTTNGHDGEHCINETRENRRAELNGYVVEVVDPGGKLYPMAKSEWPRVWSTTSRCVESGKTFIKEMVINRLVNLDHPGVYHIRVSHRDKITNEIVWSNSLVMTLTL